MGKVILDVSPQTDYIIKKLGKTYKFEVSYVPLADNYFLIFDESVLMIAVNMHIFYWANQYKQRMFNNKHLKIKRSLITYKIKAKGRFNNA